MTGNSAIKQFNFTEVQVAKLMSMQDELNTYIHPEWKTQGFDWYEAIVDECGEIKGHLGWKWWKQGYQCGVTEANTPQIKLEVIDILHFLLSGLIENWHCATEIVGIFNGSKLPDSYTVANATDRARFLACDGYYPAVQWSWLALAIGLSEQEILETYAQKYVLNKFRQDHGYKDGSYVKVWKISSGVCDDQFELKEDNEMLAWVVEGLKLQGLDTTNEESLYTALELLYNSRL